MSLFPSVSGPFGFLSATACRKPKTGADPAKPPQLSSPDPASPPVTDARRLRRTARDRMNSIGHEIQNQNNNPQNDLASGNQAGESLHAFTNFLVVLSIL